MTDSGLSAFSHENERIAHLVRLCARGFNRALSRRLASHGVTFGQWVFLRILWKKEGLTQRELSEIANLTEPTVHTALTRLEKQGVVERRTKPENRRKQYVHLTDAGRALRDKLEPLAMNANDTGMSGLSDDDQRTLRRILLVMLDNLASDEEEAQARGLKVPPTRAAVPD